LNIAPPIPFSPTPEPQDFAYSAWESLDPARVRRTRFVYGKTYVDYGPFSSFCWSIAVLAPVFHLTRAPESDSIQILFA